MCEFETQLSLFQEMHMPRTDSGYLLSWLHGLGEVEADAPKLADSRWQHVNS